MAAKKTAVKVGKVWKQKAPKPLPQTRSKQAAKAPMKMRPSKTSGKTGKGAKGGAGKGGKSGGGG